MKFMRLSFFALVVLANGCTSREPSTSAAKTQFEVKPRHIQTEYWTNMSPPSEVDVNRELTDAIGGLITINGGPHQLDGKAAIWIPSNTVILVPERTEWTGAPSHRSHLMVTGKLTKADGQYVLSKTTYEWLDQ